MQIDLDQLRLRDLLDIEKQTGKTFGQLFPQDGSFTAEGIVAFVWAMGRRDNPEFSWNDALDVKFSDLDEAMSNGQRPTPAAAS